MVKKLILLACVILILNSCKQTTIKSNVLWFSEPGTKWEEAVPLGNGRLGAMVQGGIHKDVWSLNEETLWSGIPQDKQNFVALKYLPEIRSLLNERKTPEAEALLCKYFKGPWNESYQPVGDLIFNFDHQQQPKSYRRELDMNNGLFAASYQVGDVIYTREVFASFPDNVIVARISSSRKGALNFSVSFKSQLPFQIFSEGNDLIAIGRAQSLSTVYEDTVKTHFLEGKSMRFQVHTRILPVGGSVETGNETVTVKHADEAIIILAIQTSYNGFDKNPYTEGKDFAALCERDIEHAVEKNFAQLKTDHEADFSRLFNRVEIDLGTDSMAQKPLQYRIENYREGKDPNLAALYFQFGRYLLISCSRPGTKASTLQGIWNKDLSPAWSSNYTLNCNVELNYWPANVGNLAECQLPLVDLAKDLSIDGARTAKNLYGARGWMAHHNADLWRTTSPVGPWGTVAFPYQVGGAWLCHHLWEQYLFTLDKTYLADVWPTMKGAALFFFDSLQKDPQTGWLVTNPAMSFENEFIRPDGTKGWACTGPAQDMQIIRSLFYNCMEACRVLGTDKEFANQLANLLPQLPPLQIDPVTGRLQEWLDPWEASNPQNGQVAQGWGLAPGHLISIQKTQELAEALRKTLEFRKPGLSYNSGSWTGSFPANFWARLENSAELQKVLERHFKLALFPNLTSKFFKVWEIDGNLGITAAIGEMLLQSHNGEIQLLPALCPIYATGSVKGLCARGNFEVNMAWESGKLKNAAIISKSGGTCTVRYGNKTIELITQKGKTYQLAQDLSMMK